MIEITKERRDAIRANRETWGGWAGVLSDGDILALLDALDAAEAKTGEPTHWAVHSRFGAVIGLWPDREAAERAQSEDPHRTILALYAAPPAAEPVIPEGWALVPVNATKEMEAAAKSFVRPYHDISEREWDLSMPKDFFRLSYRAMLAAAPALTTSPEPSHE